MDDTNLAPANNTVTTKSRHWLAHLQLTFAHQHARSFLAKKQHIGPLVVQKTLHPEGLDVCHTIIVHPPGGVAGGDELVISAQLEAHAKSLLTTPGAGKWYKANGQTASQHLTFHLAEGASLEWFPQENILFDGAAVKFSADVHLAESACFAGWEILCFGRQAQQEQWQTGLLKQSLQIWRGRRLIWQERAHVQPQSAVMQSITGLSNRVVSATFVVAAGVVPSEVLAQCRAVGLDLTGDPQAKYGMTALPEVFCARYVGYSAQAAKQYFEALWHILRPWYLQKSATRPRIWNT